MEGEHGFGGEVHKGRVGRDFVVYSGEAGEVGRDVEGGKARVGGALEICGEEGGAEGCEGCFVEGEVEERRVGAEEGTEGLGQGVGQVVVALGEVGGGVRAAEVEDAEGGVGAEGGEEGQGCGVGQTGGGESEALKGGVEGEAGGEEREGGTDGVEGHVEGFERAVWLGEVGGYGCHGLGTETACIEVDMLQWQLVVVWDVVGKKFEQACDSSVAQLCLVQVQSS